MKKEKEQIVFQETGKQAFPDIQKAKDKLHNLYVEYLDGKIPLGAWQQQVKVLQNYGCSEDDIWMCLKRLVRYKGQYWFFEMYDKNGNMLLVDIVDDSKGCSAKPTQAHDVTGDEFWKQMDGILYFKNQSHR